MLGKKNNFSVLFLLQYYKELLIKKTLKYFLKLHTFRLSKLLWLYFTVKRLSFIIFLAYTGAKFLKKYGHLPEIYRYDYISLKVLVNL